jgi:hypothetical protein
MIVAVFVFPAVVLALFWIYGKSPVDPATTLPVMPPR